MFGSDRSPWSLPPLCCSILLSLFRAHYAGICPSSWVFFARNTRHETGSRMAADLQVFSSDRYSCTYPVPAQLFASCNTSALLPCLLQHRLLSLSHAQSLHLHGWALGQRVFGQTSKCSVLLSSTCFAAARLFRLRSFLTCPICERCSCRRRIGIDDEHLC